MSDESYTPEQLVKAIQSIDKLLALENERRKLLILLQNKLLRKLYPNLNWKEYVHARGQDLALLLAKNKFKREHGA